MSETAAMQLRRIMHLVPRIADGAEHLLETLAAREGVSAETLQRDLRAIALRFDEPGGFVEGVQIYLETDRVSLFTNHFLRPMRLTAAELCALELGLAMLRAERPVEEHAHIDAARQRLRAVIARLPADAPGETGLPGAAGAAGVPGDVERHADPAASGDTAYLASLRAARSRRRKVRILYRKGDAGDADARVVHPYALAAVRGAWYLVSHCERASALRIFRVDRMDGVEPLTDGYAIPRDFSLDDILGEGSLFFAEETAPLRVRYSPRIARWIAERHAGTIEPDGSLVVEHPMADIGWAMRHVLQYGPDAEVLSPDEVRTAIRERLASLLGSWRGS